MILSLLLAVQIPNAMDDYLRAIELLKGPEATAYANWKPGAKAPEPVDDEGRPLKPDPKLVALYAHLVSMNPLEVRREELRRFGNALALLHSGNGKPMPTAVPGDAFDFPRLASYRLITRFATRAASVYVSDGRTDLASSILFDTMLFADRVGRGPIIGHLTAVGMTAVAVAAFEPLLVRLSRRDAAALPVFCDALLKAPLALRETFAAEGREQAQTIGDAMAEFKPGMSVPDDPENPEMVREVRRFVKLNPTERTQAIGRIQASVLRRFRAMDSVLARPESGWLTAFRDIELEESGKPTAPADVLASIYASNNTQIIVAELRTRTQLRLLALAGRIAQRRWDLGAWPKSIEEVDPLNGRPYIYEVRPDGTIKLASQGIDATGEIALRYAGKPIAPETQP